MGQEISRTIKGKGNLSVRDGVVQSRNVLAEILKFAGQSETFQFEQILTAFRLSDGKIFNDNIQLNGKDLDLNLKGWTSLVYVPSKKGNPLDTVSRVILSINLLAGMLKRFYLFLVVEKEPYPLLLRGLCRIPA